MGIETENTPSVKIIFAVVGAINAAIAIWFIVLFYPVLDGIEPSTALRISVIAGIIACIGLATQYKRMKLIAGVVLFNACMMALGLINPMTDQQKLANDQLQTVVVETKIFAVEMLKSSSTDEGFKKYSDLEKYVSKKPSMLGYQLLRHGENQLYKKQLGTENESDLWLKIFEEGIANANTNALYTEPDLAMFILTNLEFVESSETLRRAIDRVLASDTVSLRTKAQVRYRRLKVELLKLLEF